MKDGVTPIASFRLGEATMNELKSCVSLLELIGEAEGEFSWVRHDRTEVVKKAVADYRAKLRAQYGAIKEQVGAKKAKEAKGKKVRSGKATPTKE